MWEALVRKVPYFDQEFKKAWDIREAIGSGLRPGIPPDTPDFYASMMKLCWSELPTERPSFKDVLEIIEDAGPRISKAEAESML